MGQNRTFADCQRKRKFVSNDKYYDDIHAFITTNGESGVNAISKAINVPLSTVQKYLERQSFFKKTEQRKWDLPDRVPNVDIKTETLPLMVNSVENALLILKAQLTEIQQTVDNSLIPLNTLKRSVNHAIAPVASKSDTSVNIDPRLINVNEEVQKLKDVFKKQKANIPDEYADLLNNYDHIGLYLKEGKEYVTNMLQDELFELLTGQTQTLSEEAVQTLKDNQKE